MAARTKISLLLLAVAQVPALSVLAQNTQESLPLGAPSSSGSPEGAIVGAPSTITMLASLFAVVGLIILLGAIYKWLSSKAGGLAGQVGAGGKSPAGILNVLGRYPLGRGQTLVLLQVDRRVLLLCQSASGRMGRVITTSTLSEIANPDEVASIIAKATGASSEFGDVLTGYEAEGSGTHEIGSDVEIVDLTKRRGKLLESILGRRSA
jgi:flagellar biogenesis protein FliO